MSNTLMLHLTETQTAMVMGGLGGTDTRTARRFLRGENVRPAVKERLELAQRIMSQLRSLPAPVVRG